ncbi:DUF4436 family protein [Mycobacterium sp. NPDC050441]|uniref:DUF4436 family protein n=1 Tax=Mycobacterium sp. NPDC050441 TaxID=3155403 RepID=UPI0033E27BEF
MASNTEIRRLGVKGAAAAGLVLVLVMAGSLSLYLMHRNSDYSYTFGAADAADRVDVSVWITRIDPSARTVVVHMNVEPAGALTDPDGNFGSDTVLTTSALGGPMAVKKSDILLDVERHFWTGSGTVTDYPFDRYSATMSFAASSPDGTAIPVAVTMWSDDPFFRIAPAESAPPDESDQTVEITLSATRSTPTLVFAVFVMVLMLGLSIAALTASYYILRWRRGLIFPACSMMAAVLFALIPLRNAVPGDPPIGSVIDFVSFFIAEILIAAALIASVVIGYRVEIANELDGTD